jgi:hypothetical protein
MRLRFALAAVVIAVAIGTGQVHATPLAAGHSAMKPSLAVTSTVAAGTCIRVKVSVQHFRLVKPNFAHPQTLKGNAGYIRYHLSGSTKLNILREVTASTSFQWCGTKDGVRRGQNIVQVYLLNGGDTLFRGTVPVIRIIHVK